VTTLVDCIEDNAVVHRIDFVHLAVLQR